MDHLFDEFSKSLAESLPRRESLRRLGAVFAGAVLSPLGLQTAWAAGTDPCVAFCKCRKKADFRLKFNAVSKEGSLRPVGHIGCLPAAVLCKSLLLR